MRAALLFAITASFATIAQAQDAPEPDEQPPLVDAPAPVVQAPPTPTVAVPRDWRGVFDAIDRGQWDSARAGIAALPPSPLAPLAKA